MMAQPEGAIGADGDAIDVVCVQPAVGGGKVRPDAGCIEPAQPAVAAKPAISCRIQQLPECDGWAGRPARNSVSTSGWGYAERSTIASPNPEIIAFLDKRVPARCPSVSIPRRRSNSALSERFGAQLMDLAAPPGSASVPVGT
jgi:hypothetical protein